MGRVPEVHKYSVRGRGCCPLRPGRDCHSRSRTIFLIAVRVFSVMDIGVREGIPHVEQADLKHMLPFDDGMIVG
jgi:hypothetical protein